VLGVSPEVIVDDDLGLDHTWQYFQDRPAADADEDVDELDQEAEAVVYATEPTAEGEISARNVPTPDGRAQRPGHSGQTTLDEWGWSV
jgi:hypothetical protein